MAPSRPLKAAMCSGVAAMRVRARGSAQQQQRHRVRAVRRLALRRRVQRRPALAAAAVDIGAPGEQQGHGLRVPLLRRQVQRGLAARHRVALVDVDAWPVEQPGDQREVGRLRRAQQLRHHPARPPRVSRVHLERRRARKAHEAAGATLSSAGGGLGLSSLEGDCGLLPSPKHMPKRLRRPWLAKTNAKTTRSQQSATTASDRILSYQSRVRDGSAAVGASRTRLRR